MPEQTVYKFSNLSGIILIEAEADGVKGCAAFDTGAMQTALNTSCFSAVGGVEEDIVKFSDNLVTAKTSGSGMVKNLTAASGAIKVSDLSVLYIDLGYVETPLKELDPKITLIGTLGIDVLQNYPFIIDYKAETLTFFPEVIPSGIKVNLTPGPLATLPITLGGNTYPFILDTGANACVIDKSVADNIELRDSEQDGTKIIPEIYIMSKRYTDLLTVVNDMTGLNKKVKASGIIGYQLLGEQKAYISLSENIMILF